MATKPKRKDGPSFTPGPWHVGNRGRAVFGPPDGRALPEVIAYSTRANARMIAEAPTGYQLVREALQALTEGEVRVQGSTQALVDQRDWIKAARAYLAAVEGKEG